VNVFVAAVTDGSLRTLQVNLWKSYNNNENDNSKYYKKVKQEKAGSLHRVCKTEIKEQFMDLVPTSAVPFFEITSRTNWFLYFTPSSSYLSRTSFSTLFRSSSAASATQ